MTIDLGEPHLGENPARKINTNSLTPAVLDDPVNNDYFRSEDCTVPELQKAIQATVFISREERGTGATGVIVAYGEKKYLVTAQHVVQGLVAGEQTQNYCHYKDSSGEIQRKILTAQDLLYTGLTARERHLPTTEVAIFPFDGDNPGIEMSQLDINPFTNDQQQTGIAFGYPEQFQSTWKDSLNPLISVGQIFKNKPMNPAMEALLGQDRTARGLSPEEITDLNIFSTINVLGGNSGGPLVDKIGKVMGVNSGVTTRGQPGNSRFSDFRPILKRIAQ